MTLIAQHLQRSVGTRQILNNVSLAVERGTVVALLGPNGAGKTSAFQAIIGLTKLNDGQITLDGTDLTPMAMYKRARKGLGYLPQEASIFRGMTVQQNLDAVLEMVCPTHAALEARRAELLAEFGLEKIRFSPAPALSGGERRRVEIARALATNPSFLLLDEPFAGVDPLAIADVKTLIMHLKKRGMGILITDHNVRETLAIVDNAFIMAEGRVIASGTPAQIAANADVKRVYLGADFKLT